MQTSQSSLPPTLSWWKRWSSRLSAAAPLWFWILAVGLLGGIAGLGGFTFVYAEGGSYFSDDPLSCVNCHIMNDQYDAWGHGSHKNVATCNDCHTPHTFPAKYVIKGINGWNHSVAFTTGNFHEPIQITELNRSVAVENCLYCHSEFVAPINHLATAEEPTNCLACHQDIGH
ncbi:MAG: cytochrome c nitrite reductase small subunit [Chloroflexi bacterium]|nr:cytochrome c nitrite reductase small subunit [Chloroflexota bacterium]